MLTFLKALEPQRHLGPLVSRNLCRHSCINPFPTETNSDFPWKQIQASNTMTTVLSGEGNQGEQYIYVLIPPVPCGAQRCVTCVSGLQLLLSQGEPPALCLPTSSELRRERLHPSFVWLPSQYWAQDSVCGTQDPLSTLATPLSPPSHYLLHQAGGCFGRDSVAP